MTMPLRKYSQPNSTYRYGFNGKENDNSTGEGNLDFGARIMDVRIGKWLSVDPLQKKYPDVTPYNYCLGNPILFIDPDGKVVTIKDHASVKAILGGLTAADIDRINIRSDGTLEIRGKGKGSSNLENLRTLVNSNTNHNIITSSNYKSLDGMVTLPDGSSGRTLFPQSEANGLPKGQQSPDNDVYIIIKPTSESGATEVAAHEAYGHALMMEKKRQGAKVDPFHNYGDEDIPNPKYNPNDIKSKEPKTIKKFGDRNKVLQTQTWGAVGNARENYKVNAKSRSTWLQKYDKLQFDNFMKKLSESIKKDDIKHSDNLLPSKFIPKAI